MNHFAKLNINAGSKNSMLNVKKNKLHIILRTVKQNGAE